MTPSERANLLATLDLGPEADPAAIKRAYRELVQIWHPDRFDGQPALQKRATDKLAEINRAYAALKNAPAQSSAPRKPQARRGPTRDPLQKAQEAVQARHRALMQKARRARYPFPLPEPPRCATFDAIYRAEADLSTHERRLVRWISLKPALAPLLDRAAALGMSPSSASLLDQGIDAFRERVEEAERLQTLRDRLRDLQRRAAAEDYPLALPSPGLLRPPLQVPLPVLREQIAQHAAQLAQWKARRHEIRALQAQWHALGAKLPLSEALQPGGLETLRARTPSLTSRRTRARLLVGGGLLAVAVVGGLSYRAHRNRLAREDCAFAQRRDTPGAWSAYLEKRPDGECAAEARQRLEQLPCEQAEQQDSAEGWQALLEAHPQASCADHARQRIGEMSCDAAASEGTILAWWRHQDRSPDSPCAERARQAMALLPCAQATRPIEADLRAYLASVSDERCHAAVSAQLRTVVCGVPRAEFRVERLEGGAWSELTATESRGRTDWSGQSERCVFSCVDTCERDDTVVYTVVAQRPEWYIEADTYFEPTRAVLKRMAYAPGESAADRALLSPPDPYSQPWNDVPPSGLVPMHACGKVIEQTDLRCEMPPAP